MNASLLDPNRVPSMDELRAFFKTHDFSAAVCMDPETMDIEDMAFCKYALDLIDDHWEPLSRKMGLKAPSGYYGKDHPLIAMRDNLEQLAVTGVLKLLKEQPETASEILAHFPDIPDAENRADHFLHNAVETVMNLMNYPEVSAITQEHSAYEDFNHSKYNNHRAQDHEKRWNHTRAKIKVVSTETPALNNDDMSASATDVEAIVLSKIQQESFWSRISDDDKELLLLRMDGLTQEEIAQCLGYKTHSAVTKRLQKLKELFLTDT